MNAQYESNREENKEIKTTMHDIKKENTILNENVCRLNKDLNELYERHIDLQTRSMRENLVFTGIEQTNMEVESDETEEILKTFMTDTMKLDPPVEFHRAHRFGKPSEKITEYLTRPIVCRFKNFKDRELVRKSANVLKGSNYGISEQFPKEINDRRRALWPYYKEAKEQKKKAFFRRDKLFIDGRRFIPRDVSVDRMETNEQPERGNYERQGARPKQFTRKEPHKKPSHHAPKGNT